MIIVRTLLALFTSVICAHGGLISIELQGGSTIKGYLIKWDGNHLTLKTEMGARMFVAGPIDDASKANYWIYKESISEPKEETRTNHLPITKEWLIDNKLNFFDPEIKDRDSDSDGFTNLEEFHGKTDPCDSQSHPPAITKLRYIAHTPKSFRLMFKGESYTKDEHGRKIQEFQIYLRDLKGSLQNQFIRRYEYINAGPDREPYRISSYLNMVGRNERGNTVDRSELMITGKHTYKEIVLVYDEERDDPTNAGEFHNELTGETFTLKVDEEFTIPPDTTKFKLRDVFSESAEIVDLQMNVIRRISLWSGKPMPRRLPVPRRAP